MIEQVLIFFAGALCTLLLVLALGPSIWRRCQRLATRELMDTIPRGDAAVRAIRDQLRAGHAMNMLRLERRLESLRAQSFEQNLSLSRREQVIETLQAQNADRSKLLEEQKAWIQQAKQHIDALANTNSDLVLNLKSVRYQAQEQRAQALAAQKERDTAVSAAGELKRELMMVHGQFEDLKQAYGQLRTTVRTATQSSGAPSDVANSSRQNAAAASDPIDSDTVWEVDRPIADSSAGTEPRGREPGCHADESNDMRPKRTPTMRQPRVVEPPAGRAGEAGIRVREGERATTAEASGRVANGENGTPDVPTRNARDVRLSHPNTGKIDATALISDLLAEETQEAVRKRIADAADDVLASGEHGGEPDARRITER